MSVVLYGFIVSPHLRSTMMTCAALGVKYKVEVVDAAKREHLKNEYIMMNPLHSIPTLKDGDYILFDSHAISAYLANRYGGNDNRWYPKDPCLRGIVDQRLHFNNSVLGVDFKSLGVPLLFGKRPSAAAVLQVVKAIGDLDKLLGDKEFIALDWPTIADCHCSSLALSVEALVPDAVPSRVASWLRRCERSLPGYREVHGPALEAMRALVRADPIIIPIKEGASKSKL